MSIVLDGSPTSEGIASGKVFLLHWGVPLVPHETVDPSQVAREVERFHDAREWAKERIRGLRSATEDRLGPVEARIFDPQLLMLDDVAVVEGTVRYIEENRLTAQRSFEWRMLELQAMWSRTSHPLVLDRLNDVEDVMIRVLHRLLGYHDPSDLASQPEGVIVVARNLTPSLTVQMDPANVLGVATDLGTRTAHWVILVRSLEIPAVVGLGRVSQLARDGQEAILDGRIGRIVLDPDDADRSAFLQRQQQHRSWEKELALIAEEESITRDGQPVALRANLDLPSEAEQARSHGAEGIGLFRTEFLVVGRGTMPGEEEQYQAYRKVAETFPDASVNIRTFDLGGDKFPMFLHMPQEENPFLGWRAVRVCLDEPELFRTQLRALLRATAHGDVRIMVPLVNDVDEVRQVRALLEEEEENLRKNGLPFNSGYKLGIMIETPAAALDRGRARAPLRLLLDRHQRPRAVHPGGGPHEYPARQAVQPVPSVGGASAAPGLARGTRRGDRGERLRRARRKPARGLPLPGARHHVHVHGLALSARDQEGRPRSAGRRRPQGRAQSAGRVDARRGFPLPGGRHRRFGGSQGLLGTMELVAARVIGYRSAPVYLDSQGRKRL